LVVNSVNPTASVQLAVTGRVIDGFTIDLSSTQRGTNYTSSNLSTCTFGSPDGRVFAGSPGSCKITITNSGFTATAQGLVTNFTPAALSFVSLPGYANGVAVTGDIAYVAAGAAGLQIVTLSADRKTPTVAGSLALPGNANDIAIAGNTAYVAAGSAGLHVIDMSNRLAPVLRGTANTSAVALGVAVSGNIAYVANTSSLVAVDVTNPPAPTVLGSIGLTGKVWGVAVDATRNLAAVATGNGGLRIVDITTPAAMALRGTATWSPPSPDTSPDARGVVLYSPTANGPYYALVADHSSNSLTSVDITSPTAPLVKSHITNLSLGGRLNNVVLSGNFALGADVFFVNGIPITDITDPTNLQPRTIINFTQRDDNGMGSAADGSFVYLATDHSGLDRGGSTGDARLYIAQYMPRQDFGGVPPLVSITSPANGSSVMQGTPVTMTVSATDDVAVASVDFLVNGQVVSISATAPYQYTFTVPLTGSTLTLGARATDFGSNLGTAQNIVLNLIPDPPPVVSIASPANGSSVIWGTTVTMTVSATDNTAVARVDFLVNGQVASSRTAAPYVYAFTAPLSGSTLTLGALATDSVGNVGTAQNVVLSLIPDPPPVVSITSPANGSNVILGATITMTVSATDNTAVTRVDFLVNGLVASSKTSAPYQYTFTAPLSGSTLTLGALATDSVGNVGTAQNVAINLISDPTKTTVVGRVIDQAGQPISGAGASALDTFSATAGSDGSFTISDVPALLGTISVVATAKTGESWLFGVAPATTPVAGGTTNVGDITLSSTYSPFIYATSQNTVLVYRMNPGTGSLSLVPGAPVAAGTSPVSIALDPTGRFAYVANAGGNNISAYTINGTTGALTPVPGSPFASGTFPNDVAVDPTGRFVYVPNFTGQSVSVYTIDRGTGALMTIPGSPFAAGVSPRAVAVDPTGRFAYVANQTANFSNPPQFQLSAYTINAITGALTPIAGSAVPGFRTFHVSVEPTGHFAYASTDNFILAFTINTMTGQLSPVTGSPFTARIPGAIVFDFAGRFAFTDNEDFNGNGLYAFAIDASTGALSPVPGSPFITAARGRSVAADLTGRFVYVANDFPAFGISVYAINATTGAVSLIPGSPFTPLLSPSSVTAGIRPLPDLSASPCGQETSLKSIETSSATSIVFENNTSQIRRVYRLNESGQRELGNTLSGGTSYVQRTFLTNPWVITDSSGQCINIYLPTNGMGRVIISQ
jgi:6-phosphogluconolactonase (cycloisomerase 2 family)